MIQHGLRLHLTPLQGGESFSELSEVSPSLVILCFFLFYNCKWAELMKQIKEAVTQLQICRDKRTYLESSQLALEACLAFLCRYSCSKRELKKELTLLSFLSRCLRHPPLRPQNRRMIWANLLLLSLPASPWLSSKLFRNTYLCI